MEKVPRKKGARKKSTEKKGSEMRSSFDVLGSYTGAYLAGKYEEPVQDVDDL